MARHKFEKKAKRDVDRHDPSGIGVPLHDDERVSKKAAKKTERKATRKVSRR
jgi:hypothetical protein